MAKRVIISDERLQNLFEITLQSCVYKYIAYNLGIATPTLNVWLSHGRQLQEHYKDKLVDLEAITPFKYNKIFEQSRKLEADATFRMEHGLEPEQPINDRLYNAYTQFINREKNLFVERQVERAESDILDEIEFVDDEDINDEYIRYIKFARILERGVNVVQMGYLNSVNKHATTSKNVGLALKMLEKTNAEDFAEKQIVDHSIALNNNSILSMALNYEKQLKLANTQKDEDVVDVEPIKDTDKKD